MKPTRQELDDAIRAYVTASENLMLDLRPVGAGDTWAQAEKELGETLDRLFDESDARRAAPVSAPIAGDALPERTLRDMFERDALESLGIDHAVSRAASVSAPIVMHHDPALVEAYNCGYEAALANQPAPTVHMLREAADIIVELADSHGAVSAKSVAWVERFLPVIDEMEAANQPAPTAAPEQVTGIAFNDGIFWNMVELAAQDGKDQSKHRRRLLQEIENRLQPSEAAPLDDNLEAGLRRALHICRKLKDKNREHVAKKALIEACEAFAFELLHPAAPSLPAAAPAPKLPVASEELFQRFVDWGERYGLDERKAVAWDAFQAGAAHQPAQEQANTASQVDPSMALPSRRAP